MRNFSNNPCTLLPQTFYIEIIKEKEKQKMVSRTHDPLNQV